VARIRIDSTLRRQLVLVVAGLCGLAGIIIEHGVFPGPDLLMAARVLSTTAVFLFLVEQVLSWRQRGSFRAYFRHSWPTFLLSVLLILQAAGLYLGRETGPVMRVLARLHIGSITRIYLILMQVYIVGVFAVQLPHLHQRFARRRVRPAVAFVLVFLGVILLGTGLLLLPRATPENLAIAPLDALFTATSAVCVTGLIVRDTAAGFTGFGQGIILVLIQLGGLGIMSLTAALSLMLGRGIGVRESSLLREVFQVPLMAEVGRMIRIILLLTLLFETVGAALLYQGLAGLADSPAQQVYLAVFHSVSAFCNAGFSLFSDSLMGVQDRPLVMGTVSGLLILGGLGFGVILQVYAWLRGRLAGRPVRSLRLDLHARVVLRVSAILLLAGTVLLAVLEWNGALAGLSPLQRLSQAFFQSATCRTAGFNSLDPTQLSTASLFLMIILMFIGGAPGSTAGGVKVTVVAIIWANLRSLGAGLSQVRLGRREVESVQLNRAMLVLSTGLIAAGIAIFLLLLTEGRDLLTTAFEVFSALGTVGLSLGLTPLLSPLGRIIIVVLMFIGRLGPLTLAGSLVGASEEPRVRLPRGRILIG